MKGLACLLAPLQDPFAVMLAVELSRHFPRVRHLAPDEDVPPCALLIVDLDSPPPRIPEDGRRIGYTREGLTAPFPTLSRPFPMAALRRLILHDEEAAPLSVSTDLRTVTVEGEAVALTEREAALFRLLYEANGAVVPRDVLCRAVFPEAREGEDALNVYIHYLRKKLERNRRRLIRAHRGGGYSLLTE